MLHLKSLLLGLFAWSAFVASLANNFEFNAAALAVADTSPPAVTNQIPVAGSLVRKLDHIEVYFNELVSGVDADDLLINGIAATNVAEVAPGQYLFKFTPPLPGPVQVTWRSGHAIQDQAALPFGGAGWSYTLDPVILNPRILISEFMADNDETLNDENGDASDWIELFNAEELPISLNGWFLTDATNNLTKWRFPDVSILPNSYLVVFASEKNRTNASAKLHTNFRLDNNGEFLALVNPATNLVSEFAPQYPPQHRDVSYGRDAANPAVLGYFPKPTPGSVNAPGGPGFSPAVEFSVPGGTFVEPFALALGTQLTNAVIRYTLGTNLPTETSPIYSEPIRITNSVHVRARAFQPGLLPGPVRSESYLAIDTNLLGFTSNLPVVILHNNGGGSVSASADKFVMMQIFEPKDGRTSLTNRPALSTRAKFKLRGSSTEGYPKGSYALETWDEFNHDTDVEILGMPADSDWVFYAPNNFEPVLIHNPFIYQLSNDIGRYAPRTRFVEVYLNIRGGAVLTNNYNGIYVIEERIKRGPHRVDVEALEPEHTQPPEVTGGYVLKIDRADPGDGGFSGAGQNVLYVYPKEREIETPQRDPQEQYIRNYFRAFGTNLNSVAYTNAATHYSQYIDVESWIDHHLLNVLAFNVDALRLSTYFYKPRNGKIFFGPIWDFDRALGSTDGRDANPKVWSGSGGTDFFTYPWWNRLFRDPDFWQQWIDRYQELRRAQFSTNHLMALFDSLTAQLREAQPRERARWRVALRGGSYDSEIAFSKNWLLRRIEFMDTNFVAAPALSAEGGRIRPGFSLSLSGPARGTIFYTLDGTDPRASRGELSPSAIEYTGPIRLTQNARVVARVRNLNHRNLTGGVNPPLSTPWSGPIAATYVVEPPPLIITELMYHPAPPSGNNAGYTADDFEFIELKNAGSTPINLNGARFTQGITFSFSGSEVTNLAPGARVLIVKNRAAFASRYGNVANLAGEFTGTLDNNGERLVLEGPLREPILDFSYRDDWYRITDGLGFSLAIANETLAQSSLGAASSWRISQALHGSPGRPDPAPAEFARVLVNEILANPGQGETDTIELFNASSRPANVSGWLLTDDFQDPARFRIPDGTTIAPGGFLVLPERVFNPDKRGFALNASGDALYLFSADAATNLTGCVHGFQFGAVDTGVSFGRHVTSTGAEHFVAQAAQSLGSSNSAPRVGPLVISEIMFHPAVIAGTNNLIDEFIELRNITSQSVALFDARATNAWRLDGGVQFRFAPNSVVPPNGSVLVVGFDPAADSAALAAFRAHYALNAATIILGPFDGRLENTGETLTLLRPAATGDASVSYTIIDQVEYASEAPWPSGASGTGRSLQRVIASNYGNDPANWQVALPTPGLANPDRLAIDADGDGLPGDWETANGLDPNSASGDHGASGDLDRDGLSNAQEFLAGTDPRSAASFLKVEALGETGSVKIRFMAVAGKSYSIQYRETLSAGPWLKLQDFSPQSTTTTVEIADHAARGSAERFYRLVTPRLAE